VNEGDVRTLQMQLNELRRRQRREQAPVGGLSHTAVRVLGAVARRPDEAQPSQVGDELKMTSSNVAAALRELDAGGYIRRDRDAVDTRRVNIGLTSKGQQLVIQTRAERDSWLGGAIEAELDDREQAVLLEAGRLVERLAQHDDGVTRPQQNAS
jgi:DNA-binding MarR family transcriptional regulator